MPSQDGDTDGAGEWIVQAAIMVEAIIYTLPRPARHHTIIRYLHERGLPRAQVLTAAQGFITNTGRFVGRAEARRIAKAAGQLLPGAYDSTDLFSEDVW